MPDKFATAAQVNARLDQGATVDVALIDVILQGVTAQITNYCGRMRGIQNLIFAVSDYVEYPKPDGRIIQLAAYPVTDIVAFKYDLDRVFGAGATNFVENEDYVLYPETGRLERLELCWPTEPRALYIQYDGGYATIPYDIQEACIRQAVFVYVNRRQAGISQIMGVDGQIQKYQTDALLKDVEGLLAPYVDTRKVML